MRSDEWKLRVVSSGLRTAHYALRSVIPVVLLAAAPVPGAGPATRPAGGGQGQSVTAAVRRPAGEARAVALLRQMRAEGDDVTFTGVRVLRQYAAGPQPAAAEPPVRVAEAFYRLIHADGRTWRSERLASGAESPAVSVTIRNGRFTFVGKPGGKVWYQAALPPPRDELADLDLALRNYRATLAGTEEVAGRQAVRVQVRSRWPNRPSLILSLDAANHFRLRVQRLSAEGQPVRDQAYERIRFEVKAGAHEFLVPPDARVVSAPAREDHSGRLEVVQGEVDFPVLLPEWLPEGFRPTAARVSTFRVRDAAGKMVPQYRVHLGYGDGVTTISLFQARTKPPPSLTEPYQAARQREVWVLTGYRDGLRLTLVGELGCEDLARMLSSVGPSRRASRTQPAGAPP